MPPFPKYCRHLLQAREGLRNYTDEEESRRIKFLIVLVRDVRSELDEVLYRHIDLESLENDAEKILETPVEKREEKFDQKVDELLEQTDELKAYFNKLQEIQSSYL